MESSSEPIFFDRDPETGRSIPTTYETLQISILTNNPISGELPADIDRLLRTAVDYIALAYEQANIGRTHLYESLTNDALLKASLALELGLRRRLGHGNGVRLVELIDQGLATNLLPSSSADAWVWNELRRNRNALTHGSPSANSYGPATSRLLGCVIDAVSSMYERIEQ